MAKNYMTDVAKLLGVELEEEFKIKTHGKTLYKLTERGLKCLTTLNGWEENYIFVLLLCGKLEIEKLPRKPGYDETYYRPSEHFTNAVLTRWHDTPWDFAYQETGMLFRTAEECEAALPALKQKYLGGDGQCD